MTRKRTVLLLTLTGVCLSLLVATSGVAQEEAEKEGPRYPFFYLIKNKVDPGMMPQYRTSCGWPTFRWSPPRSASSWR